ncbi:acyl-CoA dehydrogenase family protein [Frankia sp. AgW1.1]|nr:acyl-CoA dehydrogenase family protein [Frankia sp. AgW1.1]
MLSKTAILIAADLAPDAVGALVSQQKQSRHAAQWAIVAEAGLVGLHVPADLGGGGGTVVDAALVVEQLAGALAPVPYVGAGVWAPALLAHAHAYEATAAVGSGRLRLSPVLRRDLSGLARRGEPGVAFDAQGAHTGLLIDEDSGGLRAVSLGEPTRSIDLTRTLRSVPADASTVDVGVPLGGVLTADSLQRVDAVVLALLAADLLGVMQRALDEAVRYVSHREQFGVPVGSFQAVAHLAAHAATLVEGARSSMWHGAWAADELPTSVALLAARQAKAFCSAAGREVGELTIQMFGGIGLTWEHLSHVRQRRALMTSRVLGDESAQYAAIADERLAARETA